MDERYLSRGKLKDNGEWITGYYVFQRKRSGAFGQAILELDFDRHLIIDVWGNSCEVIPETVEQCTGLTDKNGRLIFTGDILHIKTGKGWSCPVGTDVYYKVVFTEFNIECYSCTEYIGFMAERSSGRLSSIYYIVTCYGAEAIGNIHDNPELLQRSDEK